MFFNSGICNETMNEIEKKRKYEKYRNYKSFHWSV